MVDEDSDTIPEERVWFFLAGIALSVGLVFVAILVGSIIMHYINHE